MLKLLVFSLTVFFHVQPKISKWGPFNRMSTGVTLYGWNTPYGWNKKPARQMNMYGYAKEPQLDWFYDMGYNWKVSNNFSSYNPYYAWYKKAAKQMYMYSPAKHVGKINRGQFFNPELNMPAHRAYGYQSDFNPSDFRSGVFKYKPQGQRYRATAVHVNQGLASYVGEVRTMPIGQQVQGDGTILIQTYYQGDPCNPNPCTNVRMPKCTVVNKFTAKCSRSKDYQLTLTWSNPLTENTDNDLDFYLVPARHDGSLCDAFSEGNYLTPESEDCGVRVSEDDIAFYSAENIAEETATLTTLADGTKYQDYTYALLVSEDYHNLSEGGATLTVEYDGVVKQTLTIPQFRPGGVNLNYNAPSGRDYYFFGCFRPQYGFVDTRGAGFYYEGTSVFAGLKILDVGLCKKLLSWTDGPGFNPYEQGGSGDETYSLAETKNQCSEYTPPIYHYSGWTPKCLLDSELVFDARFYLETYDDLRCAFIKPNVKTFDRAAQHWCNNGVGEGRQGSESFSSKAYLAGNEDLGALDYVEATTHFITTGYTEGRNGEPTTGLNPTVTDCSGYTAPIYHYSSWTPKCLIDSDLVLDARFYLATYKDLRCAFIKPGVKTFNKAAQHWCNNGAREGRRGSATFNSRNYLARYADLQNAFGSTDYLRATKHFIRHGFGEGRDGT